MLSYKKKEEKISTRRQKRIEHFIRKEIEDIIRREVSDPRVGFFTITTVHITPDYKFAKVGISFLGGEEEREKGIE
ncbi:ribosome-binding factor A, partial [bacterium]|nr:ribosome-binding factor A [bacterium]